MDKMELKPCPFCGSKDIAHGSYDASNDNYVHCSTCRFGADDYYGKDDVLGRWNTRPIEEALEKERDELRERLARFKERDYLAARLAKYEEGMPPRCVLHAVGEDLDDSNETCLDWRDTGAWLKRIAEIREDGEVKTSIFSRPMRWFCCTGCKKTWGTKLEEKRNLGTGEYQCPHCGCRAEEIGS